MQLIEVRVNSGDAKVLIEFIGEGGEQVTVASPNRGLDRDSAVRRAKQMMLEIANGGVSQIGFDVRKAEGVEIDRTEGLEETAKTIGMMPETESSTKQRR